MAWQLLESSELMCSLTQCNRNAVGSRILWDSSRPFPQKTRHWFGKKRVTLWDSCHAPLCTSPVTPSKVFYFLVRPEGLPKKSRLSYPLYRWEVRPGRSSICQFFGEFWNQLVAKQKQKTAKTQISPGLSSFISIATTRCTSAFMRHFRTFFTCNRRSILNQRRGRTWIAQTFP